MSSIRDKEAFVTGHTGTSVVEVCVIAACPALLLLIHRLHKHGTRTARQDPAWDFALLVLPQVLALVGLITPAHLAAAAALLVSVDAAWQAATRHPYSFASVTSRLSDALSAYRASLMIVTCISILGVDFHAFPRRFAKTETFGTGLMDAGVGCIVAATAMASGFRNAANAQPHKHTHPGREAARLAALVGLGLGRAAFAAASGYQVHVGEYGVHWNFFLTLAALRIFMLLVPRRITRSGPATGILGLLFLAAHQYGLSAAGLLDYVHSHQRGKGLLSANKEGIFSLPGYFALHLLGACCGAWLRSATSPAPAASAKRKQHAAAVKVEWRAWWLAAGTAALWAAYYILSAWVQPASRRACNATFVVWMLALNVQSVSLVAAALAVGPAQPLPGLLEAVNSAMLPTFLVANVLTGGVNMTVDTLAMTGLAARAIVAAYMAAVCAAAVGLRYVLTRRQRPASPNSAAATAEAAARAKEM